MVCYRFLLFKTGHAHLLTTKHHLSFIEEPVLHILMVSSAQNNTIVNHFIKIARTHTAVRWSWWWSHKRKASRTRSCDCNCAGRPPCIMPGPVHSEDVVVGFVIIKKSVTTSTTTTTMFPYTNLPVFSLSHCRMVTLLIPCRIFIYDDDAITHREWRWRRRWSVAKGTRGMYYLLNVCVCAWGTYKQQNTFQVWL